MAGFFPKVNGTKMLRKLYISYCQCDHKHTSPHISKEKGDWLYFYEITHSCTLILW